MGPMGELGALFNPGMRHELEERRSKAARREEEGNARDGDLHIDLASGVAVINVPSDGDDDAASGVADPDADSAGSTAAADVQPEGSTAPESGADAPAAAPTAPDKGAVRPRGKRGMASQRR